MAKHYNRRTYRKANLQKDLVMFGVLALGMVLAPVCF